MISRISSAARKRDQGFTLIELLVVIIIIGILAAVAIPLLLNQKKKAIDASMQTDLRTMALLQATYVTVNLSTYGLAVGPNSTGGSLSVLGANDYSPTNSAIVTVTLANKGFCAKAYSPLASTAVTAATALTYDSLAGGLGKTGGAC